MHFDPKSVLSARTLDVRYPTDVSNIELDSVIFSDLDVWRLACALDGGCVDVSVSTICTEVNGTVEEVGSIELRSANTLYCAQPTVRSIFQEISGESVISIVGNENIFLRPEWQRKGIGRLAVAMQAKVAHRLGFSRIRADVGGIGRPGYVVWPAIGFDGLIPGDVWSRFDERTLKSLGLSPDIPVNVSAFYRSAEGRAAWEKFGAGFPMELVLASGEAPFEALVKVADGF